MIQRSRLRALLAAGVFVALSPLAARDFRPGLMPNGAQNSCANCHIDPFGGGDRNAFGQAVEALVTAGGEEEFWGPDLAALDSDGDGCTNGEELGDPAGLWAFGEPDPLAAVTNPGDDGDCEAVAEGALEAAFIFGSRNLDCETPNEPGTSYSVVFHEANTVDAHNALAYEAVRGWGFEVLYDPATSPFGSRNGSGQFGPFDDSPNPRNVFDDECPEEIYDSFIGAKNFTSECSATTIGDASTPCSPTITAEGIIFRVDVPNGFYRFVGAFGSADNRHAMRILAEDGGSGTPDLIGPNHVVLVSNHDQAEAGTGNFARVGFGSKLPPEGNGVAPDPAFTNMDASGLPTACPPSSPVLEVTQGFVRIHALQANSNPGAAGARDPNGANLVLLELWAVPSAEVESAFSVDVAASVEGSACEGAVIVHLDVSNARSPATIRVAVPICAMVTDPGAGEIVGEELVLTGVEDGRVSFGVDLAGCCPSAEATTFSVSTAAVGACPSATTFSVGCCPVDCPRTGEPELMSAFAFGSRDLDCPTYSEPSTSYTMVHHRAGDNADGAVDELIYSAEKGWGFEEIAPEDLSRGEWARIGPFDDSPNNRGRFGDDCPEELYDSFIGFKNHPTPCTEAEVGNLVDPCPAPASGGIFRVDVPNGVYRFVAAVGEADNPHSSRVLAENGGTGAPANITEDHVVLVSNFDQNQWDIGTARADCLGCGVFGRVGFDGHIPPFGDGAGVDPQFVNLGPDGLPLDAGVDGVFGTADDECPSSPELVVTEGYVRFHLLQGNANVGPGSRSNGTAVDPNGPDIVVLELWRVDDVKVEPMAGPFLRGDCNGDGSTGGVTDAVFHLAFNFLGAAAPPCNAACDSNADGGIAGVTDPVFTLNFNFLGGAPIPAPFPGCGLSALASDIALGCGTPAICP